MITIDDNLIVPMAYSTISGVMFPTIRLFLLEDIVAFPIHTNVSSIDDDIQINIEESEIIDTYTYIEILYEVRIGLGEAYIISLPHDATKRQYIIVSKLINLDTHGFIISNQLITGKFWFDKDIRTLISEKEWYDIEKAINRSINNNYNEIITTPFTIVKIHSVFVFKHENTDIVGHIGIAKTGELVVGTRQHAKVLPIEIDTFLSSDLSNMLLNPTTKELIRLTDYEKIDKDCVLVTRQEADALQTVMQVINSHESIKPMLLKLISKR